MHVIGYSPWDEDSRMFYLEERARELKTMNSPIEFEGREYTDIIKFCSGNNVLWFRGKNLLVLSIDFNCVDIQFSYILKS
mgnify:CR=1 FL=1